MNNKLIIHTIYNYQTFSGVRFNKLNITYQLFGKILRTAPVVLVLHGLTGNSDVADEKTGWWNSIIGTKKVIDTNKYTIIGFNIIGNGYDGNLIDNYQDFTARDIAQIFINTLKAIGVNKLYSAIGGSLGGGIAWEMAALAPDFIRNLIPVAADWKSTDWIIAYNYVQDKLLHNSKNPVYNARMMAMLFYRTPVSFTQKFNRTKTWNGNLFNIESWLHHHGKKLNTRFELPAYKMMNHLLATIDITQGIYPLEEIVKPIQSNIIQIGINTDLFFVKEENIKTKKTLDELEIENQYHEIKSIHGHDAFLIEYEQLTQILEPFFK